MADDFAFTFVKPLDDSRFEIRFPEGLRTALDHLAMQLGQTLDDDHPDLRRLYPTAYTDDEEKDAGFQILARPQLDEGRLAAIARVRATVFDAEIDDEDLGCWMRVINDVRLVLGTRLDVSEDDREIDDDDPHRDQYEIYYMFGFMLEHLVQAMSLSEGFNEW